MEQLDNVKVEDVSVRGPYQNQKTGEDYYAVNVKAGGVDLVKFQDSSEPPVNKGDVVTIVYKTSKNKTTGKASNQIQSIKQGVNATKQVAKTFDTEVNNTPVPQPKTSLGAGIKSFKSTVEAAVPQASGHVSKDTSMEVSGILQALLSTGQYNRSNAQGQTFIEEKLLDQHLRRALRLKRSIANELEQNGQV